uniref:BTB domain-containing protein n=1 Tax=Panagrolaimus sp. ES5 TaxID=591445 RepID=A0AC34FA69_9BILA
MDAKEIFYQIHKERYELFKSQDSENEDFDVVFDFNGKKLYANKFTLFPVSTTFKSMLSDRWTKPDEPIEIKDYTFEDFKEFLTFFYSGACELTDENIFAMVDMAEFYNITIFKWADNRTTEKQKIQGKLNVNKAIKEELSEFLPLFNFKKMNGDFFIKFVVKKSSFLFSSEELSNILWAQRYPSEIRIVDGNGKSMKGELQCDDIDQVVKIIQSKKNICCTYTASHNYYYWATRQPKPSTPSKLTKNDKIEWYLLYDYEGDLAVKKQNELSDSDYLLAELVAEYGFQISTKCKIET